MDIWYCFDIKKQVAGYAVGGGHILHMVCDLTIAADNAIFGQTGPKVLVSFLSSIITQYLNHISRSDETNIWKKWLN